MVYVIVILISVLLGVSLSYYLIVVRKGQAHKGQYAVVSTLEQFAEQITQENDRVIEMMAMLRQKIDQDALLADHKITLLQKQCEDLESQLRILQSRSSPQREGTEPEFLAPKYQEVASRLMRGDDPAKIAQDMHLGRGEIDLVKHLIQQHA